MNLTIGRVIFTSADNYEGKAEEDIELIIHPKAGRLAMFTSGPENTHYVEPVVSGQRFVLSFWFTCNPQRKFEIFLDGKEHKLFSHRIRDEMKSQGREKLAKESKQEEL
jgi:hypothetical protein